VELFKKIKTTIDGWEQREFYMYTGIYLGFVLLCAAGVTFRYYSKINSLSKQIDNINELREERVRVILNRAQKVQKQRVDVDTMLSEDEDFKIGGYFKDLLATLQLTEKKESEIISQTDREDNYRESVLSARFVGMNMKLLTELLNKIEQNKRIYSKELEIVASKKTPQTLEVSVTIATLQPKTEVIE
jgi:hypothetical protein